MKQFLTTALFALTTLSLAASTPKEARSSFTNARGETTYWNLQGKTEVKTPEASKLRRAPRAPEKIAVWGGEPKHIDVEFIYDENQYHFDALQAGMMDAGNWVKSEPEGKKLEGFEIPYGSHALFCLWQKSDGNGGSDLYVWAKDIYDLADGAKVTIDIAECVNRVEYNPLGADGNPLDIAVMDEGHTTILEPGEFNKAFSTVMWNNVHDGLVWMGGFYYGKDRLEDGTERYIRPRYVYYNDCGPDFITGHFLIADPCDGVDFTCIEMPPYVGTDSKTSTETTLANDPQMFRTFTQKWMRSPYSAASYQELMYSANLGIDFMGIDTGVVGSEKVWGCTDETESQTTMHVCFNSPATPGADITSMRLIDIMPEDDSMGINGIASMWWKPTAEGRSYQPENHGGQQAGIAASHSPYSFVEGNFNDWLMTLPAPNLHLAYDDAKAPGILGNNTPIISLMPDSPTPLGSDMVLYYMGLTGRYGEGNLSNICMFIDSESGQEYDADNKRTEILSCENIMIDGEVDGKVTAELRFVKGSGEDDIMPPVITQLTMYDDANGTVNDRFATAADGRMEFYAADFYVTGDWELGQYGLGTWKTNNLPADHVKMEYAPYGSQNFKELPVTPVRRLDFFPAYGHLFSVLLESVEGMSSNGWFDIRLSMEDERGNTHVQTVSPAFKLLDSVGVETVGADDAGNAVYYDLTGCRVEKPSKGIFVERKNGKARKMIF